MTKNETYGNVWRKVKHWFLFIFLELDAHVYIGGSIPTGKTRVNFFNPQKKKKKNLWQSLYSMLGMFLKFKRKLILLNGGCHRNCY